MTKIISIERGFCREGYDLVALVETLDGVLGYLNNTEYLYDYTRVTIWEKGEKKASIVIEHKWLPPSEREPFTLLKLVELFRGSK